MSQAIVPDSFPFWAMIQSNLPVSDPGLEPGTTPVVPYFVVGSNAAGASAVLSSTASPMTSGLWRITPDQRILCGSLGGLLLSVDANGYAILAAEVSPPQPAQRWTLVPTGREIGVCYIQNQGTGGYLYCMSGSPPELANGTVLATAATITDGSFAWSLSPSGSLGAVCALPATPFPSFSDGPSAPLGTMYAAICAACVPQVADLREQYPSLTFNCSLPTHEPPCPAGLDQADWDAAWGVVMAQLHSEVDRVKVVQRFHSLWFTEEVGQLAAGIAATEVALADLGLDVKTDNTDVGAIVFGILESVAYTILSGISAGVVAKGAQVAFSVLANLMQGAIDAGESIAANGGPTVVPADPVNVAISEVWKSLSDSFVGLDAALASAVQAILTDWGKLQAGADLMTYPQALALTPTTLADGLAAVQTAQLISVLQMVMPVKYQIYNPAPLGYEVSPHDIPAYAMIGGRYIAGIKDNETFPSEALMAALTNAGVNLEDLAAGNRGWALAEALNGSSGDYYCAVRIVNSSPFPLKVDAGNWSVASSTIIPPFESQAFWAPVDEVETGDGPVPGSVTGRFSVTDNNGVVAASFQVDFAYSGVTGQAPVVSGLAWGAGYTGTEPLQNGASIGSGGFSTERCFSAAALVNISYRAG